MFSRPKLQTPDLGGKLSSPCARAQLISFFITAGIVLMVSPGGALAEALDGSSAFRHPDQHGTIRGRAWAIQDGILDVIDAQWNHIRMVKQIGSHAGTNTTGDLPY